MATATGGGMGGGRDSMGGDQGPSTGVGLDGPGGGGRDYYDSSVYWMRLGYPDYQTWVQAGSPSNVTYQESMKGGGGGRNGRVGKIGSASSLEDAWMPGFNEAGDIYNKRGKKNKKYDKNKYLNRTMDQLMAMQDPSMNPYLDEMYGIGAENLRNEMFNSLGASGRGRPVYADNTGGNDTFANYVDSLSNFGTQFYGQAYNQDMDRALRAGQTMATAAPGILDSRYNRGWNDLQQYSNIVSQLTGSSAYEPAEPEGSNDMLQAVGTGIAAYAAFASSKDYKEPIAAEEGLLPKVQGLDIDRWKYHADKGDGGEHIGPYAEDFKDQFGVGDGKSISVIDATGVTFGALKELADEVDKLKKRRAA